MTDPTPCCLIDRVALVVTSVVLVFGLFFTVPAGADEPETLTEEDWAAVSTYVPFSTMQAVDGNGAPTWSVPILEWPKYAPDYPQAYKLRGVVLNDPVKMLDDTPNYQEGPMWAMGGQWQVYVQAVSLPSDPAEHPELVGDYGGSAVWMGQNYGNHYWHFPDWSYNYTNEEWVNELDRLNYPIDQRTGQLVTEPLRLGDLIEVRARGGLSHNGKFNCNEEHTNELVRDFQIFILDRDLPLTPENITLADVKEADNSFIFDSSRLSGAEHYQACYVTLENVTILETGRDWESYGQVTVKDGDRTFDVKLGYNPAFDLASLPTDGISLDITGIFDQEGDPMEDYRMWALSPADFAPASPLTPGDANGDGVVNADDAVRMAGHWGTVDDASWFDGDFNGDGCVDAVDAAILGANWAAGSTEATPSAVPEPGALVMLLTVLGVTLCVGRFARRQIGWHR